MAVGLSALDKDAVGVEFVYAHLTGSVDDAPVAECDADMGHLGRLRGVGVGGRGEEDQVVAPQVAGAHFDAGGGLL